jgi:flagellar biogenesis protein FliO
MPLLTRSEIEHALTRLGELALGQNLQIELIIVGGAAMVLGYNARQATHDVDALIVKPRTAQLVRDLAKRMADELNLAEDWLNDGAKRYLRGLSNAFLDLWEGLHGHTE